MNIANVLHRHAERWPDQIAIVDVYRGKNRRLTYRELEEAAGRVATLLRQHGLGANDTALVLHPMSAELYIILAAIFRLGMVAMFLDPSAGREHIARCCQHCPPQALIASSKAHLLRIASPALRQIPKAFYLGGPVPRAISLRSAWQLPSDVPTHDCPSDSAALITFTSGTTAEAKAALRTHGFLLAQHRALEESLELRAGEVDLTTQPIFVLANLASRVTSVIPNADLRRPDAIDPAPVVTQLLEQNTTRCGASPAFYGRLVQYCLRTGITLPGLARIFTGGGPVSPRLMDQLKCVAPQATVTAIYGCTEAEPIASIARHQISENDVRAMRDGRGLLAGCPVPILRMRIMRHVRWGAQIGPFRTAEFEAACQPQGEAGEIVVSGQHVLTGYLNGLGDEQNKFEVEGQRWHRTGDAGYLDGRGRLWLLGRCAARIEDTHGTLYPLIVEHAASHHDCVHRASVASIRGERVLAVEPRKGRIRQAELACLLESLAFAHIRKVHILKRMPVDSRHNSKIDYSAMSSLLEKLA